MSEPGSQAEDSGQRKSWQDYALLTAVASAVSLASFIYFFRRGEILLYGDAVAHINIARRVFDSRTPGWQQLGTVWLPLPHLLVMPFIVSNWVWRTGVGGSLASMVAYVFGGVGVARLFWGGSIAEPRWPISLHALRLGGWLAALFYLLNPNLIYLQSTAMTEPLSMALGTWAVVFYAEFQTSSEIAANAASEPERAAALQRAIRSLRNCGVALAAGMLTRYDNWFLAVAISGLLLWQTIRSRRQLGPAEKVAINRALRRFVTLVVLTALLWLGYNYGTYGNALEFATGPYSARAIAQRSAASGVVHPGYHDLGTAALYFFKCAKLNIYEGPLVAAALLTAIFGTLALLYRRRKAVALLLWLPLTFYALSIAYGGVPIFMPRSWPFSYYNVRYGLQLLPMFSVTAGLTATMLWGNSRARRATVALLILIFAAMYGEALKEAPITLREARVNSVTRLALEKKLADAFKALPPEATLLMYTGDHAGALQQAGFSLKRVVTENNYHLWQSALQDPAQSAQYVVAMNGDPVWQAVERDGKQLQVMSAFYVPGQPAATIYRSSASRR